MTHEKKDIMLSYSNMRAPLQRTHAGLFSQQNKSAFVERSSSKEKEKRNENHLVDDRLPQDI